VSALLTGAEMREALDDPTSPYYLEDDDRRAVLRDQVRHGRPIAEAIAGAHLYQHYARAERGTRPLAVRTERGDWRWTR
jgi:hypothetical protein